MDQDLGHLIHRGSRRWRGLERTKVGRDVRKILIREAPDKTIHEIVTAAAILIVLKLLKEISPYLAIQKRGADHKRISPPMIMASSYR